MQNYKPVNTHVKGESLSSEIGPKTPEERDWMACVPYSNVVGSLMYAMIGTHLKICYTIGLVNSYQSNPRPIHSKAINRILRYLKGIVDYKLCYQRSIYTLLTIVILIRLVT